MSDFVHLHLHSEYSLLDGACRITDIPAAARRAGHTACAITDHGVMYGAVAFYKECKKEGIKPIIGCEVYVANGGRHEKSGSGSSEGHSSHLVLLCKNEIGYKNLIYMVSQAFIDGFYVKPRIDMELLRSHHDGLIALSACLGGYIPKHIMSGDYEGALANAIEMKELFGGDFYLEVQDHGIAAQKTVNDALYEMSEELGIPLVATNDVHYLKKSDSEAQALLMCIQTASCIKDGRPIGFETDEFYYKETWEMERLFADHPEAIENTVKIADECNFDFEFGHVYLPEYICPDAQSPDSYLRSLTMDGLARREQKGETFYELHSKDEYISRVEYELSVIAKMGYSQYYLIVWDFVNYSRSKGIPVGPGRGSGAGSLVAYLIGITDIDPMRFELLFERFLNPERVSMPDFDIDFCYNRRDEAIDYVREKYGSDRTAQIVTFGTMAARAVVRDVGRAMGMPYNDVDAVAKLIPRDLNITLDEAIKGKELREMYESDPEIRQLINTARALEGMPRHPSVHAAGVVITELPLTDHVPLAVNNGVTVTQFDMNTIAELGLLKFDFLALRYLTIIDNSEKLIREAVPEFDITKIPLDDKATYSLISKGNTDGVFQLESGGMKQTLMQLRPSQIDDIIAAIALYRPGPMSSIPKYVEARHSGKKEEYVTPLLAPILDSTYGCIVYQEQVMQIFRDIAGFSMGHADIIRSAISKKKVAVLLRERDPFIKGAGERGIDADGAEKLFDDIADFGQYAFNRSHAAAYALLAYRTAYLKTHYLLEYNCALITSVLSNPQKIYEYLAECKKHGIRVVSPSVNVSKTAFSAKDGAIVFGLGAIKNIGAAFCDILVAERDKNGLFKDFDDFLTRMQKLGMNKRQMESLIKAGALDCLGIYRSKMLAVYEGLMERGSTDALSGQLDIFAAGQGSELSAPKTEFPDIKEFSTAEKLKMERESSGMFLSGHMLDDYSENSALIKSDSIAAILAAFSDDENDGDGSGEYKDKQSVTVVGIVSSRTNKATRAGEPMAFVTLDGGDGSIEAIIFPAVLSEYTHFLMPESAVAVQGRLSVREDEEPKLLASKIIRLAKNGESPVCFEEVRMQKTLPEKPKQAGTPKLYLKISAMDDPVFKKLQAFISIFRGSTQVVVYDASTSKASHLTGGGIALNEFTVTELAELLGKDNVVIK